jgi:hypothetical protein
LRYLHFWNVLFFLSFWNYCYLGFISLSYLIFLFSF